jgi:PKD repeat protein
MRTVATALMLVILIASITTCGTYRAVTNDYASDAPILQAVTPTQTVSGQEVKFVAQFCDVNETPIDVDGTDGTPAKFFWDFGGGAEPNTTTEESPTVTIRDGIRAPYTCHLTLTDGCMGDDNSATYEFTLFVTALSVLTVTPTTGIAGGAGTFSAVVGSGAVNSYAWDFGGACTPGGSSVPNPSVTFTDTPGIYQARVIVSNNFEAVEFPFTLTVVPAATP